MKKGVVVMGFIIVLVLLVAIQFGIAGNVIFDEDMGVYPLNNSYTLEGSTMINFTFNHSTDDDFDIMLFASNDSADLNIADGLVYQKSGISDGDFIEYNFTAMPTKSDDEGLIALYHFDNRSEYRENLTQVHDFVGTSNATCSGTSCPTFNSTGVSLPGLMNLMGVMILLELKEQILIFQKLILL